MNQTHRVSSPTIGCGRQEPLLHLSSFMSHGLQHTSRCMQQRRQQQSKHTPAAAGLATQIVLECCAETWQTMIQCPEPIVALGKFDALHRGHQSLAVRAAEMGGQPVLLSFHGMAEVLGWPPRMPLVAPCDRPRVLRSWTSACHGKCPQQRSIPFQEIRTMDPEAFVKVLAEVLGAAGVVAGENYRFGYKAAGDAEALQRLGAKYGLRVSIVDLLQQDTAQGSAQVSSSQIRKLLETGDMRAVQALLGRPYRLVCKLQSSQQGSRHDVIKVPKDSCLNLMPGPGDYQATLQISQNLADLPESCSDASYSVQVTDTGIEVPAALVQHAQTDGLLICDFL